MRQLVSDIEHFRTLTSLHIVSPLCPLHVFVFNFAQTESLLQRAYKQLLWWLDGSFARSLTLLARVNTPIASDTELRSLRDFGCAVESTNCMRKVEAPPAI